MRLYRGAVAVLSWLIRAMFRTKVVGRENVPKEGACLICANHISNWDPVLVAVAVKRPIFFMAKKELFQIPVFNKLLTTLGAFPVDREAADISAIKTAFTHIKHGEPVGIFPQGKRYVGDSPDAHPIKNGTGMMVHRTAVPVIPVSVYTKDYAVKLFRKVYITIGAPILSEEYAPGEKSQEEYQRISDFIFDRICFLTENAKKESEK